MTKQPEALRLANELDEYSDHVHHSEYMNNAANELRRLHEVNAELLDTLHLISIADYRQWDAPLNTAQRFHDWAKCRVGVALNKATGEAE